jgi:hypothetical protein
LENQNYPPTASLWKHPIPFLVQGNLCPCFFSSAAVAVVVVANPIDINLYNSTLTPINLASLQKKPFANRQSEKLFDTCRTKMSIDSSRKTNNPDVRQRSSPNFTQAPPHQTNSHSFFSEKLGAQQQTHDKAMVQQVVKISTKFRREKLQITQHQQKHLIQKETKSLSPFTKQKLHRLSHPS